MREIEKITKTELVVEHDHRECDCAKCDFERAKYQSEFEDDQD